MNSSIQSALIITVLFFLFVILTILVKYFIFNKYRSPKSKGRFWKGFYRWYTEADKQSDKTKARKKTYMGWNNFLNIVFWVLVLLMLVAISAAFYFFLYTGID
jgi:lipoprotein signal peptidase